MRYSLKSTVFLLLLLFSSKLSAQGILFSQHRFLLEDHNIHTLQVCNPTKEIRSFQLSVIDKSVDANHKLVDVPDSVRFPYSLKSQIRVFPRRITLAPGDCQEVQLQLRNTASLTNGEYRSYLHFLPLLTSTETQPDSATHRVDAPSFDIIVRIGAAIPMIYRKKTQPGKVLIDSVTLVHDDNRQPAALSFYIHRTGSQSVYGNIAVYDLGGKDIKTTGTYLGNAVYAEAPGKPILMPIASDSLRVTSTGGYQLKIVYTDNENQDRKDVLGEWTGELR